MLRKHGGVQTVEQPNWFLQSTTILPERWTIMTVSGLGGLKSDGACNLPRVLLYYDASHEMIVFASPYSPALYLEPQSELECKAIKVVESRDCTHDTPRREVVRSSAVSNGSAPQRRVQYAS